jgi:Ca-activated chloride channel family protein
MTQESNYYTILGVDPQATPEMIREAFASWLDEVPEGADLESHPDYQRVLQAYEALSDPERRATYDALLAETGPLALSVDVQSSRDQVRTSDAEQMLYLLVSVRPPADQAESRLPLNLCLVIDRSTSMQGARLDRVKSAVALIIEKLAPEDVISAVSFSDRAEVVLPAEPVRSKQKLSARVGSIRASGGTEIYRGLDAGMKQMQQVRLADYTNHLILLTDGHTYGDVEECLQLAHRAAAQGVSFTAFGIGSEWNDQFLDKLVAPSGGQTRFIETSTQIVDYLQERIKGLGTIYARDLRLSLDFPKGVSLRYGFKLTPFTQPLTLGAHEVKLGDIEGRSALSFLLELAIAPQPMETRINIPVHLTAEIPGQQRQEQQFKHQHQLFVLSHAPPTEPPPELVEAVRTLNMHRMSEKAWEEAEAGELDKAATRMRRLTTRLLEAGETELAQQAHAETERLANMEMLSAEGRKRLKFGTRSLVGRAVNVDSDD